MGTKKRKGRAGLRTAGLFAGIGGLERGLARAGHTTELLCEIEPAAGAVLRERFPGLPLVSDVRELEALPAGVELVAAGFPCQDLSQAGETNGIKGRESGLVDEIFRLLRVRRVPWLLLENVPFMLQLGRGSAIRHIADELENLGYKWAYRVVDTRAFGIPQRRERVFLIAAQEHDPSEILYQEDEGPPEVLDHVGKPCGFFWTEGLRGLGWAVDSVPTLKGGSGLGIPSPPAIWMPDGGIVTPDVRDAERLQGFPADWTEPALEVARPGHRWKLVGNAVTVDVAEWLGEVLRRQPADLNAIPMPLRNAGSWPKAAFGNERGRFTIAASAWPIRSSRLPLQDFLEYDTRQLSERATAGFLSRLRRSSLRYPPEFRRALEEHLAQMSTASKLEKESRLATAQAS